jgi:hypothetical protein
MSIVTCQHCGKDFTGPTLRDVQVIGFGDNSRAIGAGCPHCGQTSGILPPGDGTFSTSPVTGRIERVSRVLATSDLSTLRQLTDSLTVARATRDLEAAQAALEGAGLLDPGDAHQTMSLREQRIWQLVMVILAALAVIVPLRANNNQPSEDQIRRICQEAAQEQQPKPMERRKVGRNDLCPCGSGAKFKRCHGGPPRR